MENQKNLETKIYEYIQGEIFSRDSKLNSEYYKLFKTEGYTKYDFIALDKLRDEIELKIHSIDDRLIFRYNESEEYFVYNSGEKELSVDLFIDMDNLKRQIEERIRNKNLEMKKIKELNWVQYTIEFYALLSFKYKVLAYFNQMKESNNEDYNRFQQSAKLEKDKIQENKSTTDKNNNLKFIWKGSASRLAYILNELNKIGHLEFPKSSGSNEINYDQLLELISKSFDFKEVKENTMHDYFTNREYRAREVIEEEVISRLKAFFGHSIKFTYDKLKESKLLFMASEKAPNPE